jgi:hypothetical protein
LRDLHLSLRQLLDGAGVFVVALNVPGRRATGRFGALKAARDAGVERVVMTSSISAIIYGRGVREKPFTEEDWTDETNRSDTSPWAMLPMLARAALVFALLRTVVRTHQPSFSS